MKIERECPKCAATYKVWEYCHIYVPRTPDERGWLCRQCPKCFSVGGIKEETNYIQESLLQKLEAMKELKIEIHELRSLLRHIGKGSVSVGEDK